MNRRWGGDGVADADPSSHLLQLPCSAPLPRFNVRSASASPFSGLLHVDCTLQPACSPSYQSDLLHQRLRQFRHLHNCTVTADFFEPLQLCNQMLSKNSVNVACFKSGAGHATDHSEVFQPSGVFGHYGLVCYLVSGRRAGTNYILSRNFWRLGTRCSGKRIVHRWLERRFFGRRGGKSSAQ
jgi:hypothetical protein